MSGASSEWRDTGLAAVDLADSMFSRKNYGGITSEEGIRFFAENLGASRLAPVTVQLGTREVAMLDARSPGFRISLPPAPPRSSRRHFLTRKVSRKGAPTSTWEHTFDLAVENYLSQHLVHGHATVPGVMELEMAAEAAAELVPDATVRELRDITFPSFLRVRPDRPATCRVSAHRLADFRRLARVRVSIHSDGVAPDGSVLRRRRPHCTVDVLLARTAPVMRPWPDRPSGETRHVANRWDRGANGVVHLTGVFAGTSRHRLHDEGGQARYESSVVAGDPTLPHTLLPCVLIDALLRVPGTCPDHPTQLHAPTAIGRIALGTSGNDTDVARRHPEGIDLHHVDASNEFAAVTAAGQVLVWITDAEGAVLERPTG